MLDIYDNIAELLKRHIEQRKINATVTARIGKDWHRNRYIRVFVSDITHNIFYQYKEGHWTLCFQIGNADESIVNQLRKEVIRGIESNGWFNWHRDNGFQKGVLAINAAIENRKEFIDFFNDIWDNTINYIVGTVSSLEQTENSNDYNNNSLRVSNTENPEYHNPEIFISPICELSFNEYCIPKYQRPYKWLEKNANQLINDIITFSDRQTQEYRLGTLVLYHAQSNNPLEIVDGQQRIITLLLLLSLLMNEDNYKDLFTDDLKNGVNNFFKKPQFKDVESKQNIKKNYTAIKYRIAEFNKERVQFVLEKCKFVVVTLYDISEAFQFFDSQNARGKKLEPQDLLKAYHLREIPSLSNTDKNNIKKWEQLNNGPQLSNLFILLFRIKRWIETLSGKEFTSQDIDTFKGPREGDRQLPYQKIYVMAECYAQLYNTDISRKLDRQHLEYPHQIDQVVMNGSLFFDMIRHYSEKNESIQKILSENSKEIYTAINTYREKWRRGDIYTRALFDAAILFYIDKFGISGIDSAIKKIFVWAYSMRLTHYSVKLATMDNTARDGNSFFNMLHRATTPSDIQNWVIPPVTNIQQTGMDEIKDILKKYKYIE